MPCYCSGTIAVNIIHLPNNAHGSCFVVDCGSLVPVSFADLLLALGIHYLSASDPTLQNNIDSRYFAVIYDTIVQTAQQL